MSEDEATPDVVEPMPTAKELSEWLGILAAAINEIRVELDSLMMDSEGRGYSGIKPVPTDLHELRKEIQCRAAQPTH